MPSPRGVTTVQQETITIRCITTSKFLDDDDDDIIVERMPPPKIPPRSPTLSPKTQKLYTPPSMTKFDYCGTLRPQDVMELADCPCCKNCIDERQLTLSSRNKRGPQTIIDEYSQHSAFDESVGSDDEDDEDVLVPGVTEGLYYHPRRIIAEGWVHKKGTGQDWIGSRSWKPRWARLVMANLEGYQVEVPLLMIYWYAGSPTPSNVIILDSTVAFSVDMEDKAAWDAFRFDIRNAKTVASNTTASRTFCAPKKARDAWIYAISQALLSFEKENAKVRKAAATKISPRIRLLPVSHHHPNSPPRYEESWSSAAFPSGRSSPSKKGMSSPPRPGSPPTSPTSRNYKSHAAATQRAVLHPAFLQLPK